MTGPEDVLGTGGAGGEAMAVVGAELDAAGGRAEGTMTGPWDSRVQRGCWGVGKDTAGVPDATIRSLRELSALLSISGKDTERRAGERR